jgi:hypothetical protein
MIIKVLHRRWNPLSTEQLADTIVHAEDPTNIAQSLTELAIQYGTRGWVDRALENVGPDLLDWLERLADMFEMLRK